MQIKFLGYGGAFDLACGNSSAILKYKEFTILIDCGFDVYPKLVHKKLVDEITHIIITHLHNDHSGSLVNFLLHRALFQGSEKLKIIYPDENLKKELELFIDIQTKNVNKYVDFVPVTDEKLSFISYINTFGMHVGNMQTYALAFTDENNKSIVFSGDLKDANYLFNQLKERNIHTEIVFHDMAFQNFDAHTYYKDLEQFTNDYKIIGYHHNPEQKPAHCKIPSVAELPEFLFSA